MADKPENPLFDALVAKFGSQEKLGAAAGVGQTAVSEWKRAGFVPSKRIDALLAYAKENGIDLTPADFFPSAAAATAGEAA